MFGQFDNPNIFELRDIGNQFKRPCKEELISLIIFFIFFGGMLLRWDRPMHGTATCKM